MEDGGRRLHDALNQRGGAEAGFGPSANHNAKVILRFYCGLAALGVVSAASTLAALRACVVAATKVASAAGSKGGDVREWLPFADFLVEASLLALPWGARALQENAAEAWAELVASVDGYLEARGEVRTRPANASALLPQLQHCVRGYGAMALKAVCACRLLWSWRFGGHKTAATRPRMWAAPLSSQPGPR